MDLTSFRNTFPAAAPADAHWTDTVITEGHVAACAEFGHADWVVDGVTLPRCPRCGEVKPTAPLDKGSRVLHHRFALLGTVVQVSAHGPILVQWDMDGNVHRWYSAGELVNVTGEGV